MKLEQIYQNVYTGREELFDAVEEYIHFYIHECNSPQNLNKKSEG